MEIDYEKLKKVNKEKDYNTTTNRIYAARESQKTALKRMVEATGEKVLKDFLDSHLRESDKRFFGIRYKRYEISRKLGYDEEKINEAVYSEIGITKDRDYGNFYKIDFMTNPKFTLDIDTMDDLLLHEHKKIVYTQLFSLISDYDKKSKEQGKIIFDNILRYVIRFNSSRQEQKLTYFDVLNKIAYEYLNISYSNIFYGALYCDIILRSVMNDENYFIPYERLISAGVILDVFSILNYNGIIKYLLDGMKRKIKLPTYKDMFKELLFMDEDEIPLPSRKLFSISENYDDYIQFLKTYNTIKIFKDKKISPDGFYVANDLNEKFKIDNDLFTAYGILRKIFNIGLLEHALYANGRQNSKEIIKVVRHHGLLFIQSVRFSTQIFNKEDPLLRKHIKSIVCHPDLLEFLEENKELIDAEILNLFKKCYMSNNEGLLHKNDKLTL